MARLEGYCVVPPIKGMSKYPVVMGKSGDTNFPLLYLQRPKWIKSDSMWQEIVNSVRLELPGDFDLRESS